MLDAMTGDLHAGMTTGKGAVSIYGNSCGDNGGQVPTFTDSGGASRFFFRADYDESEVAE